MIKLGKGLTLPLEAVTQTFGLVGHKGSGKSYTATKLAEEMLLNDAQVVVLDPIGVWYGLRLKKNGKPSQFDLPIMGGLHGDIPLEHKAGKTVADFAVDTASSCILDVSLFRKGQRKEFVADFAEQLFLRQKTVRRPVHLVIEEAQVFAPQRCGPGEQRMLGALEDIVKLGRNVGIGVSLITQRPQSVNKEVLNQAEPLMVFRLIAKQERDAIQRWLEHVGGEASEAMKNLPNLKPGQFYFWSPSWLDTFKQGRAYEKKTADVSATPKVGKQTKQFELKPVNLEDLNRAMSDVIERAEENDPKKLKATIVRLEKRIQDLEKTAGNADELKALREHIRSIEGKNSQLVQQMQTWAAKQKRFAEDHLRSKVTELLNFFDIPVEVFDVGVPTHPPVLGREMATKRTVSRPKLAVHTNDPVNGSADFKPGEGHIRILKAFFWTREEEVTVKKIAFYANYTVNGHFKNLLGNLRSAGMLDRWRLTQTGLDWIRDHLDVEAKPTGNELIEWLRNKLKSEMKLVDALHHFNGRRVSMEELAQQAGYTVNGHFKNMLGKLRTLGVAEGTARDGGVKLAEVFFAN